jgi:hypothetical protein
MKAVQTRCPQKSPCSVQRLQAEFKAHRGLGVGRSRQPPLFPVCWWWPWRKKVATHSRTGLTKGSRQAAFV